MKRRKNSNLHVVREAEDPTDKIIEEIMDELNSEDGVTEKELSLIHISEPTRRS